MQALSGKLHLPLGIPTVTDRVVQAAVRMVIEPIFENRFAKHSYGFRPGCGCKDALRRVEELLRAGNTHIVDVDIKCYFDTIPHDRLMALVRERIADGRVLGLLEGFLKQGVIEGMDWQEAKGEGTPQGDVISPLLANIYLDPLDWLLAGLGFEMVRYADDMGGADGRDAHVTACVAGRAWIFWASEIGDFGANALFRDISILLPLSPAS